jgi:hypothetical protein
MQGTENDRFVSFESHNLLLEYSIRFPASCLNRAPSFDHRKSLTQFLPQNFSVYYILLLDTTLVSTVQ